MMIGELARMEGLVWMRVATLLVCGYIGCRYVPVLMDERESIS